MSLAARDYLFILTGFVLTALLLFPGHAYAQTTTVEDLEERIETLEENQSVFSPYVSDFGGRMQFDATFNVDDSDSLVSTVGDGNRLEDGSEFRRLRAYVSGDITSFTRYKVQADFSNGDVSVLDAYMEFHDLPYVGNLLIGRFKEPLTLDEYTSSKYLTFLTRSALSKTFNTGWNNGVQWSQSWHDSQYNLTLAGYHSNDDGGVSSGSTNGKYNLTGRFTSPLVYEDEGRELVHLGLNYSHRQPGNSEEPDTDVFETSARPEVHQTDRFISTRITNVESYEVYGGELAGVSGPLSFQAEYFEQGFDRSTGREPDLDGYYGQVSWFLTGEHRPYSKSSGNFGRVNPRNNFLGMSDYEESGGAGAWELTARFSNLDFSDAAGLPSNSSNRSSEMEMTTVGVNWYPHSHTRWMLNYVDAEQDQLGDAGYVTTRFQVDF